uniref:Uncharacterized protein n=1 Tax=Anguilla anguilla TaxID=7936 RepID=A0A0E9T8C7_ANGAN
MHPGLLCTLLVSCRQTRPQPPWNLWCNPPSTRCHGNLSGQAAQQPHFN